MLKHLKKEAIWPKSSFTFKEQLYIFINDTTTVYL